MSIFMHALSDKTYTALSKLCAANEWEDVHEWMEPEMVAWLTVRLEFVDDTPEHFPKGKWATIQRLQDLLRSHAGALAEKEKR